MTKADDAQAAAAEVRDLVFFGEQSARALIAAIAPDYGVKPEVVEAWLLREFSSIEELDAWGASKRTAALLAIQNEEEARRRYAQRFDGLVATIESMSRAAVERETVPQFTPWWRWIKENSWEPIEARQGALAVAYVTLQQRRLDFLRPDMKNA